jgi:glycine/D-amino acid oxidase-like deaminating enzyme
MHDDAPEPWDVIVVGGGAAGVSAARAAHAAGARVAIVCDGPGATALTAGWVAPGNGEMHEEAFEWFAGVGLRPVGAYAFASLSGALVGALSGLTSLLDLTELPEGPLGVVDLVAGTSWSAPFVARSLERAVEREVSVVHVGDSAPRGESCADLARALDTVGLLEGFAERLRPAIATCGALLFPPVLGFARDDVATRLTQLLGIPVGETGGGPGDGTALRLARAVAKAIPEGVVQFDGCASVHTPEGDERVASVRVGERTLRARAVVLATGGLVGGGLSFEGVFRETCADAPVWFRPAGRHSMILPAKSAERGMDPQPLFSPDTTGDTEATGAGVRVTRDMRVVGGDGQAALAPSLFAAGDLLTGASAPYGQALAEVIASGHRAGREAAAFARAKG